jgi:hypothetical protein
LDDERMPQDVTLIDYPSNIKVDDWSVVRSYKEAIEWINLNGLPDFISFDNDLGEQKEGKDVVKYVIEYCIDNNKDFPSCAVHSKNPIASDFIVGLIDCYKRLKDDFDKLENS